MKIAIFGLGYVGCVSAACFAKLGNKVTGVDLIKTKVDSINKGEAPIKEKELEEMVREQVRAGRLSATSDVKKAVISSEISFICVGTPPKRNGDIDLDALKRVCEGIGNAMKEKEDYTIVIRSTMFPGSFNILKEVIEKSSGKKYGKDFGMATNPEFLREGTAIKDFFNPPFVIIGAENKKIYDSVIKSYDGIEAKKISTDIGVAQMIKYASNSFHALKISFANELSAVCKKLDINSKELMEIFCSDTQLNISPYYLKPGFAYGGSCLPKDLAALKNNSEKLGLKCPIIDSISRSNTEQINRAIELIESKKKKSIGILGLTFKADTDDIRGNPIILVINSLLNKGYNIKIFDKLVNGANLENISNSYRKEVFDLINKEDLKEKVYEISNLFSKEAEVLKQDIIVVSNRDKSLKEYTKSLSKKQILIDLQSIFSKEDTPAEYNSL